MFFLGMVVMVIGIFVGSSQAPSIVTYGAQPSGCVLPEGAKFSQIVYFPDNRPEEQVSSSLTVSLPAASEQAQALAGLASAEENKPKLLTCLFGDPEKLAMHASSDGSILSFTASRRYGVFLARVPPGISRSGVHLQFPEDSSLAPWREPSESWWPPGTQVELVLRNQGRQVQYSREPQKRDDRSMTWSWTTQEARSGTQRPDDLDLTIALGAGERVTAFFGNPWSHYYHTQVGQWTAGVNLGFWWLAGWLGPIIAVATMIILGRRLGKDPRRWRLLTLGGVLILAPLISGVIVSHWDRASDSSVELSISALLSTGLLFGAVVLINRGAQYSERSVARRWMIAASAPIVGLCALLYLTSGAPSGEVRTVIAGNILAISSLFWVGATLAGLLARLSLSALPARPIPSGEISGAHRHDRGSDGLTRLLSLFKWDAKGYLALVAALASAATLAAIFDYASALGQQVAAYRSGGMTTGEAVGRIAESLADSASYPALYLIVPVTAAISAAAVSSRADLGSLRLGAWILAAFSWSVLSRVPDFTVFGIGLPVGSFLLAFFVLVGASSALTADRADGGASESPDEGARREAWIAGSPLTEPTADALRQGPSASASVRVNIAVRWSVLLAALPVGYLIWGSLVALPSTSAGGRPAAFVVAQVLSEVLRWTLTGWLYGLLLPWLPGRVGPLKALWMVGAWFLAAAPIAILNGWTGNGGSREWIFPGLQLMVFLTALSVLVDASTLSRWRGVGNRPRLTWTWTALGAVYKLEGIRPVLLYAGPALLAIVGIGQQVVNGTGLDFISSVLSATSPVLGGR